MSPKSYSYASAALGYFSPSMLPCEAAHCIRWGSVSDLRPTRSSLLCSWSSPAKPPAHLLCDEMVGGSGPVSGKGRHETTYSSPRSLRRRDSHLSGLQMGTPPAPAFPV